MASSCSTTRCTAPGTQLLMRPFLRSRVSCPPGPAYLAGEAVAQQVGALARRLHKPQQVLALILILLGVRVGSGRRVLPRRRRHGSAGGSGAQQQQVGGRLA